MRSVAALLVMVLTLALLVCGLAGCVKPLFPKDQPRTQFETYDRLRSREAPLQEPDVFGNPQPALRARLSQQR
jgi:hypothetical protein